MFLRHWRQPKGSKRRIENQKLLKSKHMNRLDNWYCFNTLGGSPFQLGHLNATILFSLPVAIPPFCIPELGGLDKDLGKGEARRCLQSLHMNMYASVQSKD